MKTFFIIFLVFLCFAARAQNKYLKDIQKSVNEFTRVTQYTSPSPWPGVEFYKTFLKDSLTSQGVEIIIECPLAFYNIRGAYIKLDNDDILKDEKAKPEITYTSGIGYVYYAQIELTNAQMQTLAEHSIVKFAISDLMENVNKRHSEAYKNYISCLNEIKQP